MPANRSPLLAVLLAGAVIVPGQSLAQNAPDPEVKVTGQKMPVAEAPRAATCEALARDPTFRAQLEAGGGDPMMGPHIFVPTRLPRNPDYSKPPSVAAGSPLPDLPKLRFGARETLPNGEAAFTASEDAADSSSNFPAAMNVTSLEAAVDACRSLYMRGGGSVGITPNTAFNPTSSGPVETRVPSSVQDVRAAQSQARFRQGRAFIASRDQTLPMAFALFDQGRYAEALDWFRKAQGKLPFQDGGGEAALFMGKIYLQGLGDRSDPAEAVKWLTKAATGPFNPVTETPQFDPKQPERNTAAGEAAVILANLYRRGFPGIAKDSPAALKWFARAYALGHVPAAKMLGDFYHDGVGVPPDVKKAASYYERAAKLDYAPAQFALAEMLSQGEAGVRQDRSKALAWYAAAAKHNHGGALFALARAYDLGDGVKADPQMAIGFYKSAALQGNAAAMVAMGTYFYEGKLVAKDDATARRWFEAGATGGDADGMFDLAAMLANAQGGERDRIGAWFWLKHAAALGHDKAPAAISALEGRMTPAERQAAAERLAAR